MRGPDDQVAAAYFCRTDTPQSADPGSCDDAILIGDLHLLCGKRSYAFMEIIRSCRGGRSRGAGVSGTRGRWVFRHSVETNPGFRSSLPRSKCARCPDRSPSEHFFEVYGNKVAVSCVYCIMQTTITRKKLGVLNIPLF